MGWRRAGFVRSTTFVLCSTVHEASRKTLGGARPLEELIVFGVLAGLEAAPTGRG